jgi:hypothetical protein
MLLDQEDVDTGLYGARRLLADCSLRGEIRTGTLLVVLAALWKAVSKVGGVNDSDMETLISQVLRALPVVSSPSAVGQTAYVALDPQTLFCVRCFADDRGGSWGEGTINGHCFNCGAGGSTVTLPVWAVDTIRKNGSWVCKRYYPADEDMSISRELRYLRSIAPAPSGRSAERIDSSTATPNDWRVSQKMPDGSTTTVYVNAQDEYGALRAAAGVLPYPLA